MSGGTSPIKRLRQYLREISPQARALLLRELERGALSSASFPGLDPHGQALKAGVKISGATVHFVIPETDAGPVLMQGAVAVRDDDTPDILAARILKVEHRIYPDALRLLASGLVRLDGDTCKTAGSASSDATLISPAVSSLHRSGCSDGE